MALQVLFSLSQTLDDLYVPTILRLTDTTGAYDASTNPTGWGTPNATYASCQDVTIRLQSYDGDFDETVHSADIGGWTPTANSLYVDIPATAFGIDSYLDMDYIVTYTCYDGVGGATLSSKANNALFDGQTYGNIINNLLKCRPDVSILNPDQYVDAIARINSLRLGAVSAFNDGAYSASDEGIKKIQLMSVNLVNYY